MCGPISRPEGCCTGAGDVGARSRTGAAAGMLDAATFLIGWTLRSGLRWWPRRAGSAIGNWIRSLARDPGGRWYRPWIGARSLPSWSGWRAKLRRRGTAALLRRLGPIRDRVHTGTADHGKEFARHREIAQKLDPGFYFATPYHSWERGRNEHTNGLVRQYFPKGTDFRQVTAAQVRAVEDRLHRRPRKVLGYRTPAAVFARGLAPPGRGRRSPDRPPGSPVTHRSGLARPYGAGFVLALADDFGQDRRPSRWLPSEAEKQRSQRGFLGRRRDPSLRATPSFRDRGDCCTSEWKWGQKKYGFYHLSNSPISIHS